MINERDSLMSVLKTIISNEKSNEIINITNSLLRLREISRRDIISVSRKILRSNLQLNSFSDLSKWISEYKGKMAKTPAEASKNAEYIFTCVGNDNDLREVTFGDNGVFKNIKKGSVYIDNTTASATFIYTNLTPAAL